MTDPSDTTASAPVGISMIQIAAVRKAQRVADGDADATKAITSERTHHVTFKVPIYMAANFRENTATAKEAEEFLATHAATTAE